MFTLLGEDCDSESAKTNDIGNKLCLSGTLGADEPAKLYDNLTQIISKIIVFK